MVGLRIKIAFARLKVYIIKHLPESLQKLASKSVYKDLVVITHEMKQRKII